MDKGFEYLFRSRGFVLGVAEDNKFQAFEGQNRFSISHAHSAGVTKTGSEPAKQGSGKLIRELFCNPHRRDNGGPIFASHRGNVEIRLGEKEIWEVKWVQHGTCWLSAVE